MYCKFWSNSLTFRLLETSLKFIDEKKWVYNNLRTEMIEKNHNKTFFCWEFSSWWVFRGLQANRHHIEINENERKKCWKFYFGRFFIPCVVERIWGCRESVIVFGDFLGIFLCLRIFYCGIKFSFFICDFLEKLYEITKILFVQWRWRFEEIFWRCLLAFFLKNMRSWSGNKG